MRTLLLVDDEPLLRRVMQVKLERGGYSVQCVGDGAEALSLMQSGPVDMVLADLRMPGMSGIELLRRIRERHPRTPVAIITAYGSAENQDEAIDAGAVGFLIKPVPDDDLFGLVAEQFDG